MLRSPVAAVDGSVEIPAQDDEFKLLAAPAALIARVRNQSDAVQSFAFQVDGAPSCTVKVPAMTERRIDCSARAGFAVQSRHIVKIRGAPSALDARISRARLPSRSHDRSPARDCLAQRLAAVPPPARTPARPFLPRPRAALSHHARTFQLAGGAPCVSRCHRRGGSRRCGNRRLAVALALPRRHLASDVRSGCARLWLAADQNALSCGPRLSCVG